MKRKSFTSATAVVARVFRICRPGIVIGLSAFLLLPALFAQKNRILAPLDSNRTTALRGNVNPRARTEFDAGPVDPSLTMSYMTLAFAPSDAQMAELENLLEAQQDPASPQYRKWLTPAQYADRFGLSRDDFAQALSWLRSSGFTIVNTAHARNWIAFRGTAGQIQQTFHTEIHRYTSADETHIGNASEPVVPSAMAPMVSGILGLDDFRVTARAQSALAGLHPNYTNGSAHALVPDDLATIYDLTPLYKGGFDGSGQSIAITGDSKILLSDIQTYRKQYSLPAKDPQLVLVLGATDPGIVPAGQLEASLDVELAGAVARNANIIYVYSGNIGLSALYAVDLAVAPVVSTSASVCESQAGTNAVYRTTALQASAQGITWVTSSGDSGAANCDDGSLAPSATRGLSVSIWAANPNITGVGGTTFNDGAGNYWNSINSATGASAVSYIPEQAWNETSAIRGLAASGGGISTLFARPSWQVGPGVPAGNFRLVPDIALAAAGHTPYFYVNNGGFSVTAGTSAAAPAFAGLIGILNQYQIAKGFQTQSGQGNINPILYRLYQSVPTAFHDVTTGNNIIPCASGSTGCTNGSYGYNAGPGYDLVTGLGSVDANNLVTQWNISATLNTTLAVTSNPATFNRSDATQLTATVTTVGSTSSPAAGSITFSLGTKALGTVALTASGANATASLSVKGNLFPVGTQTVTATYVPSAGFNGSTSSVNITVGSGILPVVDSGGVVPVYSSVNTISAGSWVSIFGTNLAVGTVLWNGDFPTKLGGVTVTINGKPAYLWLVSPNQINLQAPDDTATGNVNVVVTNENGSTTASVTLAPVSPSFSLLDGKHVTGIIVRSDSSGAYAGGSYDIVGPTGTSLGYRTVAAKAGDNIVLFGVGFGATTDPNVRAGRVYSGAAATTTPVSLLLNSTSVVPSFAGLSSAGLYQFNFVVPAGLGTGDVPLVANVAGVNTPTGVVISLQ